MQALDIKSRVCMLTSVHQPFDIRIFHKEASSLAEAGYQVNIVAPQRKSEMRGSISIQGVPCPTNRLQRMFVTTWRVLATGLKQQAEVYHFHDSELLGIGLLLKALGKKVIYDVHEDLPKTIENKDYLAGWARTLIAWCANGLEKASARTFDAVVPATDDIAAQFASCRRVVTVKNFPILTNSPSDVCKARSENFRIIYIGALSEARGVSRMVEAVGYLDDIKGIGLVLCGDFSPASYEAEVKQLHGFEKTDFLGYVEHSRGQALLKQVDIGMVCIQPLDQYLPSLPTKLFEYMAAGLPVIASNFQLWKEIVEGNSCGLCVDPTNPREIADAIRFLRERPELREEMGLNGRRAVVEKYNWQAESQSLIRLYEAVVAS
jgi:glycosyltransferase involved in cell wall biosynthesis